MSVDVLALPDQAARDRIASDLEATLFVEAGAGSGKTHSLVDRVEALVRSGVEMRHIAAITFTEKAATELRDRIRRRLEERTAAPEGDVFVRALEQVDAAAISTLHAFAQRILTEHPIEAGLPPDLEVLDEVASQLDFQQRWRRFRDDLLDRPDLQRTMLLALAADIRLDDLRQLASLLGDNWDLVAEPGRLPWDPVEPPRCDAGALLADLDALAARADECTDPDDLLCALLTGDVAELAERLRAAADEFEVLEVLRRPKPTLRARGGQRQRWRDKQSVLADLAAVRDARERLVERVSKAALHRIALEVADFTIGAADARRRGGRLEFHDLLVMARELLRNPTHGPTVRTALRQRYQRLLLDEFQDTDPIQIDLAVLIASSDAAAAAVPWPQVTVEPGRLFFVGDPKQSIYRFRRADIEVFLAARDTLGDPVLALTTNFRSSPPVIAWVNHVFGRIIRAEPGSQPAYTPLAPSPRRTTPPAGPPVLLLGTEHPDAPDAQLLREREAADVAGAVTSALAWQVADVHADGTEHWRPARLGDITILLPARTSLPALERALEHRGVPYRAETSSLVYATREVRDLLACARALADPTDRLALVTALRSPLFACSDDDLVTWKLEQGGAWNFLSGEAGPPRTSWSQAPRIVRAPHHDELPGDHPVAAALAWLGELQAAQAWLTPSEVLDRIVRERQLFELGFARGRPRDLWRRLRFVIDQARAWSTAEAGTLRQYVEWAHLQASETTRVAETILPETDDDSVRIMTIHAAKGLEFPIAILSGMTTASRTNSARVQVSFPPGEAMGLRIGGGLTTPEFEDFKPVDEQMDVHERLRLLYVAATRARDHLVVSVHRRARTKPTDELRRLTNAELIARAAAQLEPEAVPAVVPVQDRLPLPAAAAPLPPFGAWAAERAQALDRSAARRTVGASDVELPDDLALDDEGEAGTDKQPRDLDLAPWLKGRYGTAIGRAVHAVLQTVDLGTGDGLEQAAAAQAAAEGVVGREAEVAQLARAALDAPAVRTAVGCPRWRETFVAAPVGGRTLEGYIDLLYRTADGLVVVDYKTASTAADLAARVDGYRAQGGAYAVAVEQATGEHVARVVFVFLTPDGAVERELPQLRASMDAVRAAVAAP